MYKKIFIRQHFPFSIVSESQVPSLLMMYVPGKIFCSHFSTECKLQFLQCAQAGRDQPSSLSPSLTFPHFLGSSELDIVFGPVSEHGFPTHVSLLHLARAELCNLKDNLGRGVPESQRVNMPESQSLITDYNIFNRPGVAGAVL